MVDGPCKFFKQSFKLPVGFCFLARPTVLERASDRSSQSRVGLLGLPRLAGGIPPVMGRPWGHRCWNLQRAQQPDLLSQVINNRGCIFTLFTKKASLPPPKYHWKLRVKIFTVIYIYMQFLHTSFSVYSEVGFTSFIFYVSGSCLVLF